MKGLLKNLALVVTTSAVCLIAGEYTARFVFRDITTTSDNRSYFAIKWKQANVKLNSLRYRTKNSIHRIRQERIESL